MGTHQNINKPQLQVQEQLPSGLGPHATHQKGYPDAGRLQKFLQGCKMLPSQNFCGRHHTALIAIFHRLGQSQSSDDSLATAHVTLQNAMHGQLLFHISANFPPSLALLLRQGKGQLGQNLLNLDSVDSVLNAQALVMILLTIG